MADEPVDAEGGMSAMIEKNAHLWERHPEDYYIEPEWCSRRLFEAEKFAGAVRDPSCGSGRIVRAARAAGLVAFGADIVRRSSECDEIRDYLSDEIDRDNIVSNPPFGVADAFARHALVHSRYKVVLLLPTKWMNSALARVYLLSPRPSMPPGPVIEAGIKAGNGTTDYAWFVWHHGHEGRPEIRFLRREA
jgi:hypothetical protein